MQVLNNKISINQGQSINKTLNKINLFGNHSTFTASLAMNNSHSDCFARSNIAFGAAIEISDDKKLRMAELEKEIYAELADVKAGEEAKKVYSNPDLHNKLNELLEIKLSPKRYRHSQGAEETTRKIAEIVGFDTDKAALAGLLHDNSKCISEESTRKKIKKFDLFDNQLPEVNNSNYHASLGAIYAENNLGIKDKDILNAIKYHSQTRKDIGNLHLILYIADHIEPRIRRDGLCAEVLDFITNNKSDPNVLNNTQCKYPKVD